MGKSVWLFSEVYAIMVNVFPTKIKKIPFDACGIPGEGGETTEESLSFCITSHIHILSVPRS